MNKSFEKLPIEQKRSLFFIISYCCYANKEEYEKKMDQFIAEIYKYAITGQKFQINDLVNSVWKHDSTNLSKLNDFFSM